MGGLSSIFGGGYSAPDPEPIQPAPDTTEKEPTARGVRDEERRRLRARRPLSGTILTSPLGTSGQTGANMGILGRTDGGK